MMLRGMMGSPSLRRTLSALLTVELGGRAQPGSKEFTGQNKRLWVLLIARKDQPSKSPEPFNLYSGSSFLIPGVAHQHDLLGAAVDQQISKDWITQVTLAVPFLGDQQVEASAQLSKN